jgi:NADPH-dependent glutamate synthase beta subunit-like oxidoreductase
MPKPQDVKDAKIAIIGSGPVGLSCTYHLAHLGCQATVLGAEDQIGGNLRIDENN